LFVCFERHEQFFSYLATVIITGYRAANLDLCLALTAFSSESSFTCHIYCNTGPPFFKVIYQRPVILTSEYRTRALGEEAITTYFKRVRFDAAVRVGLELTTSRMHSKSSTTRLPQPVNQSFNLIFVDHNKLESPYLHCWDLLLQISLNQL
jgi:hypothetical protein